MSRNLRKPNPTAIATVYGWADAKTGELLVSMKNLPNPVENYKRNQPFTTVKNEIKEVIVQEPVVTEEKTEIEETVTKTKRRTTRKK